MACDLQRQERFDYAEEVAEDEIDGLQETRRDGLNRFTGAGTSSRTGYNMYSYEVYEVVVLLWWGWRRCYWRGRYLRRLSKGHHRRAGISTFRFDLGGFGKGWTGCGMHPCSVDEGTLKICKRGISSP